MCDVSSIHSPGFSIELPEKGTTSKRDLLCTIKGVDPRILQGVHMVQNTIKYSGSPARKVSSMSNIVKETFKSVNIVQQDTFVDNELGNTLQQIRSKLGNAPFIEAYKAALDTFKEHDRTWKEYREKEAKQDLSLMRA